MGRRIIDTLTHLNCAIRWYLIMLLLAWSCVIELHKQSTVLDVLRTRNPGLLYVVNCCIMFSHGVWARGKNPDWFHLNCGIRWHVGLFDISIDLINMQITSLI